MSENPYAPPSAEVADVRRDETSLDRPQIVTIGIWLLWLDVAVSLQAAIMTVMNMNLPVVALLTPEGFRELFIFMMIGFRALLTWRAGQGRNWARIGHLVVLILRVAFAFFTFVMINRMFPDRPYSPLSFENPLKSALFLLSYVLPFAAVAMLFSAAANDWYRAMRSSK